MNYTFFPTKAQARSFAAELQGAGFTFVNWFESSQGDWQVSWSER